MRVVKTYMHELDVEIREQEKELQKMCLHVNTRKTSDYDYHRPRYFIVCMDCGYEIH